MKEKSGKCCVGYVEHFWSHTNCELLEIEIKIFIVYCCGSDDLQEEDLKILLVGRSAFDLNCWCSGLSVVT